MHDDELKNLLHEAEADLALPRVESTALVDRVRGVHRRRRARNRMLAIVAAPLVLVAAMMAIRGLTPKERAVEIASKQPEVPFHERLAALEAEAERHAARARVLMAQREARLRRETADPLAEFRENVDLVAYRMILDADELQADMRPSGEAIEIYERVIRDFPGTYSAEVARERLTAAGSTGVKS